MDVEFCTLVHRCVECGDQYRISFADQSLGSNESMADNVVRSFAVRLAKINNVQMPVIPLDQLGDGNQLLRDVVSGITDGNKDRLLVVNLDETNRLATIEGQFYLRAVCNSISQYKRTEGWVFIRGSERNKCSGIACQLQTRL